MKLINVTVLLIFCLINALIAQDSIQRIKIYRTWITLNSDPLSITGALYQIKDSTVLVSSSLFSEDYPTNKFDIVDLHVKNIETIELRKNGRIGKGALFGFLVGATVGAVLGFSSGDDPPDAFFSDTAHEKAQLGAVALGILGIATGASLGAPKITIPINGSLNIFHNNSDKLKGYSIKK